METRAYRSKIGRLPHSLRTEINERLRDGATAKAVFVWLNELPGVQAVLKELGGEPINDQNVSQWRETGYKDWLEDQSKISHLRALAEQAQDMASAMGGDPYAMGSRLLAGKLMDCISADVDPEALAGLSKAVAALRAGETDAARSRLLGDKLAADRERLDLDKARFRFQVAERALDIFADEKAKAIADGGGSRDDKIKALLEYMERQEKGDTAT